MRKMIKTREKKLSEKKKSKKREREEDILKMEGKEHIKTRIIGSNRKKYI